MPFVREMSHPPQRSSHLPPMMTTPPPPKLVKPRAPKIQQQSWDDCGPPSIQLYDPGSVVVQHPSLPTLPPRSPTFRSALGQPTQAKPTVMQSNSGRHSNNSSAYNYYETRSPKSPRKFTYDQQRSPKFDYESSAAGCSSGQQQQQHPQQHPPQYQQQQHPLHGGLPAVPPRSPQITYSNGDGYDFYEMASFSSTSGTYETARRSPKAPRKFVFDAVSPRSEQRTGYEQHQQHQQQQQVTEFYGYEEESPPPTAPTFQFCTQRKAHNSSAPGRNGDGNGDGYEPHCNPNNAPITVSGAGSGGHPQQQMPITDEGRTSVRQQHDHRPRLSIVTAATMTTTTESPYSEYSVMSGSGTGTGNSMCSTAAAGPVDNPSRGGHGATGSGGHGGTSQPQRSSTESPPAIDSPGLEEMALRGRGNRRHAINITSNPCYQVLHTSHSTLDRTCSDSIVALRNRQQQPCRKSTSDLSGGAFGGGGCGTNTNGGGAGGDDEDDNNSDPTALPTANRLRGAHSGECGPSATGGGGGAGSSPGGYQHRRRGSSKGGLAYLASRRNSRDSVKSAVSNTSIFSNEDIGPLAFQASARGRQRRTSNFLELPIPDHIRPRVCSLPERPYNPRQSDDLYRLRTFSISKGTVVNCGDSIISRRSRSNTSVNSTNSRASERSPFEGSCCGGGYANVDSVPASPVNDDSMDEPEPLPRYRVVMMGDAGVGKTALVSQFMTSEYMHTYDASLDDEFGEKTVSVLLDGEETEMIFIDHPSTEMSVENSLSTYEPHGCVVVYSVVHRGSFRQAEEAINYLWREKVTSEKTVILVGNKADLARSRVISMTEGKSLAQSRDSKFIETSSGIQHNVDELLVGILKQIRLKEQRDKKAAAIASAAEAAGSGGGSRMRNSRTQMSLHIVAKGLMQRIGLADITKSRSCENLLVL